jgi:hypothetical protein
MPNFICIDYVDLGEAARFVDETNKKLIEELVNKQ